MRKIDQRRVRKYYNIDMDRKEEDVKSIEEYKKRSNNLKTLLICMTKGGLGFLMEIEKIVILY